MEVTVTTIGLGLIMMSFGIVLILLSLRPREPRARIQKIR